MPSPHSWLYFHNYIWNFSTQKKANLYILTSLHSEAFIRLQETKLLICKLHIYSNHLMMQGISASCKNKTVILATRVGAVKCGTYVTNGKTIKYLSPVGPRWWDCVSLLAIGSSSTLCQAISCTSEHRLSTSLGHYHHHVPYTPYCKKQVALKLSPLT